MQTGENGIVVNSLGTGMSLLFASITLCVHTIHSPDGLLSRGGRREVTSEQTSDLSREKFTARYQPHRGHHGLRPRKAWITVYYHGLQHGSWHTL